MEIEQMRERGLNWRVQFCFVTCKVPFADGSRDDKVLATEDELSEPEEGDCVNNMNPNFCFLCLTQLDHKNKAYEEHEGNQQCDE
jgi:hypothetical protein